MALTGLVLKCLRGATMPMDAQRYLFSFIRSGGRRSLSLLIFFLMIFFVKRIFLCGSAHECVWVIHLPYKKIHPKTHHRSTNGCASFASRFSHSAPQMLSVTMGEIRATFSHERMIDAPCAAAAGNYCPESWIKSFLCYNYACFFYEIQTAAYNWLTEIYSWCNIET